MQTAFTPHSLCEILRDLFLAEASGRLLLVTPDGAKARVQLSRGLIDWAATGSGTELAAALGLPAGELPGDAAALGVRVGRRTADPALRERVRRASGAALAAAFRLHEGESHFEAGDDAALFEPDVPGTLEGLLHGIGAIERWAPVHRILSGQERSLVAAAVPLFPVECLPLGAHEGFLLSRMDGHTTYAELSSLVPGVDQDAVTRFVYAALVLGFVEFEPALLRPFRLAAYAEQDREERQREEREIGVIDSVYAALRTGNPYLILGVTDGAPWLDVRQSYEQRKAALRPERFLPAVRTRKRDELQIIETGLMEALLKVQGLRLDAAGEKNRGRAGEGGGAPANLAELAGRRMDSLKTDRQEVLQQNERRAAEYLTKARECFREGDFHTTVEFCTLANQHDDTVAECWALLGEALARNPARRWQLRAEEALRRAVDLDTWDPRLWLKLAEFYKAQGMTQRAARYFEKAYSLAPSLRPGTAPPAARR